VCAWRRSYSQIDRIISARLSDSRGLFAVWTTDRDQENVAWDTDRRTSHRDGALEALIRGEGTTSTVQVMLA
jgi:hypothetical protein